MTKAFNFGNAKVVLVRVSALVMLVLLSACSKDDEADYCKNHYLFHAEHLATTGQLDMTLNAKGLMQTKLSLPLAILDESHAGADARKTELINILSDNQALYTLQTQQPCNLADIKVAEAGNQLIIESNAACGSENRLKQVDVSLLDVIPEMDEIEVNVTTEATTKHFAISRQCANAVFRLGKGQ